MCISNILTDLCAIKQNIKIKNIFCKCCLQHFSSKKVLIEHGENCFIINGKQSVKLKSGPISFKYYFKNLPVPLKIYADFKFLLKGVKSSDKNDGLYTEKYQDHIPCSFAYKAVCVDNKFSKKVVLYRRKNAVYRFIEAILKEYHYCKKMIRKHFNKNLIMSAEEEEDKFQLSKSYWICDKSFYIGDEKVRDNCHMTGKYRGAAHWSCNINLKLTKNIPLKNNKLSLLSGSILKFTLLY